MRIDKPADMALLPPPPGVPGQAGEARRSARIGLLAALDLAPDACARLLDEAEVWALAAGQLGPARPLHIGAPARGAQVLVQGAACAPFEQPVDRLRVGLRLWPGRAAEGDAPAWSKYLEVFGARQWLGAGRPGAPAPFLRSSLDGCAAGADAERGVAGDFGQWFEADLEPAERSAPAHLQYPDEQVAPDAEPATFGPLARSDSIGARGRPERSGQAAEATLRACLQAWPSAESALGHALVAPADQQLEQGLAGDERLELLHLHPRHPTLRVALHGMRPRMLVATQAASAAANPAAAWEDLPVRLHTLWLFPLHLRAVLLYDAVLPDTLRHDDNASPLHLIACWERVDEAPRDVGQIVGHASLRSESEQPAQRHDPVGSPDLQAAGREPQAQAESSPTPRPEAPDAAVAGATRRARRLLRRLGWDAARIADIERRGWLPGPAEPLPPLEQLFEQLQAETDALRSRHALDAASIDRYLQAAEQQGPDAAAGGGALADALAELQRHTESALAKAGLHGDAAEQLLRSQHPQAWRNLQDAMQAPATKPASPAFAAATPRPVPTAMAAAPPAQDAEQPRAPTIRQVRERLRHGASLRGACLDDLDLRGIDLSGADLREAQARGTNFAGCAMCGADLRGATLHDADLRGADLCDARLQGAHLARAQLGASLLRRADASHADFTAAELQGADLRQAVARGAVFEHADLRQVQAGGCDARGAQFADCDLRQSLWQQASLEQNAWLDCRMQGVSLARAHAAGICLEGSDLREADLCDADLRGSRATSTTSASASRMRRADLRDACWAGAGLDRADLGGSRLDGADFAGADARECRLPGIQGSGLRMQGADLRGADLRGAKLLQAMLSGADLRGACADGALCFGAELDGVRGADSALRGADCTRTIVAARRAAGIPDDPEAGASGAPTT